MILCWLKAIGCVIGVVIGMGAIGVGMNWLFDRWEWIGWIMMAIILIALTVIFKNSLC